MVFGSRVQLGGLQRAAQVAATLKTTEMPLRNEGFPMPIIGSVLRSRCWSYYPFLSVRYILPLSDSKSNAQFYSYR